MKKHLIGFIFVLIFACAAHAQIATTKSVEKTVDKIRAYYDEIAEKAKAAEAVTEDGMPSEESQYGDLVMNELVINKLGRQWRAVGTHILKYKFFYQGGETEARMYPDELVLVKVEKRSSNRTFQQEFLYNDKGALVFFSQTAENDDEATAERHIYFVLGKAIRILDADQIVKKLSITDNDMIKEIIADSAKIKAIFNSSIKL